MSPTDWSFANPGAFVLLALLPVLALPLARRGGRAALRVGSTAIARHVARTPRARLGIRLPLVLRTLAAASIVVALARPQLGWTTTDAEASGVDIVLAVDVSSSMRAEDMAGAGVDRLDVVKAVLDGFIEARPNDRIGLVAFAGDPWLVSPLTLDHAWLRKNLERVQIGMVEDGTAIGSAIASGVARLQDTDARSRLLVLLTDGANNAGSIQPELAAEAAAALGVEVYTVGVGSETPRPTRITDANGRPQVVELGVEADTLRAIAEKTGAAYFHASDANALVDVYRRIDAMETTTRTVSEVRHVRELFAVPGAFGALFLLLELATAAFGRLRIP
ncbi:MAG: VWA domain-containing protein [Alphaproteobacteria bacterium]|nr:VWA domain-containing protein [Alphaproteobacteria bacterium]